MIRVPPKVTVVATGLDGPRGLKFGPEGWGEPLLLGPLAQRGCPYTPRGPHKHALGSLRYAGSATFTLSFPARAGDEQDLVTSESWRTTLEKVPTKF